MSKKKNKKIREGPAWFITDLSSFGRAFVFRNRSFRCFRHKALETEFLCFCSGAVPKILGSFGISVSPFPSPPFVSTPSAPQITLFVLNGASRQRLPQKRWKSNTQSWKDLHFTMIHCDSTTHKRTFSPACCWSCPTLLFPSLSPSSIGHQKLG